MAAVLGQQADSAGAVAKRNQILAEQPDACRIAVRPGISSESSAGTQ